MTSRVFVPYEPLRRDPETGKLRPLLDLSPAAQFGELVFMLPPAIKPAVDPEASLPAIRRHMSTYSEGDCILMAGDMMLVAWATALAAMTSGGSVTLLKWDNRASAYRTVPAKLWTEAEVWVDDVDNGR